MSNLFSDEFIEEIGTLYEQAEKVLSDDFSRNSDIFNDFKKNKIKQIEEEILNFKDKYSKGDSKYSELLGIIVLLLDIIKYNKAF